MTVGAGWMRRLSRCIALSIAAALAFGAANPAAARARNVILVHGASVDGSTWRAVYDELAGKGLNVRVVQMPMDGFAADLAAAKRILDDVQGSTVLVAHSYGGAIITELGTDPKVGALVYAAALEPDRGESLASLSKRYPPAAQHSRRIGTDRFIPDPATFRADLAVDVPAQTAAFLAASLKPTSFEAGTASPGRIAWKTKPSFGIVATKDRTISPALERFMYRRANARITEVSSSHMVILSHPREVAAVITNAVDAVP